MSNTREDRTDTPVAQLCAQLRGMFSETLQIDEVGVDEDFFAIGGHSLAAGRIIGRLHHETGVRISLAQFFENPTARGIAELVAARSSTAVQ